MEGPENIPLEAGGGLPPPEAEDVFEAEGPEVPVGMKSGIEPVNICEYL